jgi:hypothetical protein
MWHLYENVIKMRLAHTHARTQATFDKKYSDKADKSGNFGISKGVLCRIFLAQATKLDFATLTGMEIIQDSSQ